MLAKQVAFPFLFAGLFLGIASIFGFSAGVQAFPDDQVSELPLRERVVLTSESVSQFRDKGVASRELSILLKRLTTEGPERVILKLQIPIEADELQAYGPEGPAMYQEMANEATMSFLESVADYRLGDSFHDFRAINGLPFVVMRVNSSSLLEVVAHKAVTYVATRAFAKPILNESVGFIGANTAHSMGHTGNNKTIAIIDTGVDSSHPMFSGKVVSEACYSQSDPGENWYSICNSGSWGSTTSGSGGPCQAGKSCSQGHGSHVAGIAAGSSVSPSGLPPAMLGVAYGANIISIMPFTQRYLQFFYNHVFAHQDDVLESLMRVYDLRNSFDISSVNISFMLVDDNYQSTFSDTACDSDWQDIYDVVALLNNVGIEVVAGSGNRGVDRPDEIAPPACLSNVVSVASVARDSDAFQPYANAATILDFLAPGASDFEDNSQSVCSYPYIFPDGIWSAYYESVSCPDQYIRLWGTSMATPHVSGSIALLGSRYPNATRSQRLGWLKESGASVTFDQDGNSCSPGPGCYTKPRLDVNAAMSAPSAPGSLPSPASTDWLCYGSNLVSWSAANAPLTEYQVQGSLSSGFGSPWTYYSGLNTSVGINVQQTTYVRVRACNYVSCGNWVDAGTAQYQPYCP